MVEEIAVLAVAGMSPFRLAIPSMVFANEVFRLRGEQPYRVRVCTEDPGSVPTDAGYELEIREGIELFREADTIVIPEWPSTREPSERLLSALRDAHGRGARIVGLCLGSFLIAASGIADGREITTHWHEADALAGQYPAVTVQRDVLWTDLGDVITSAGAAAALDCCLHIVRSDLGERVASAVARSLVLAPHRDGSQAQYIPSPVTPHPGTDAISSSTRWALDRLGTPIGLDDWAASAHMARRTFTRHFRTRIGTSPQQWLLVQRLLAAKLLLETTHDTVDSIAATVGLGSSASLRQHFASHFGTSPQRHRRAFSTR